MKQKKIIRSVLLMFLLVVLASASQAAYPSKPVTIVVPYGPGGAADLAARNLSTYLKPYIGQNLVVVNKAGAAGVVGTTYVARGKKDGYTLLMSRVGSNAAVPAINKKSNYSAPILPTAESMNAGHLPWNSKRSASVADTPCFLQVVR
ncbi:MAG: Bug family tripartite tricarboxylate transporter substrate binding protein [Desulfopila sp.]